MAQRGKPSVAHVYDKNDSCVHCGMYRNVVENTAHSCKPWRELESDIEESAKQGIPVGQYQLGRDYVEKYIEGVHVDRLRPGGALSQT